jgi:hypothetical protein
METSLETSPPASEKQEEKRRAVRERVRRHRGRSRWAREIWRPRVGVCKDPDACEWRIPSNACDCQEGAPCACEEQVGQVVLGITVRAYGAVLGGLLALSVMDVLRESKRGKVETVRNIRETLIRNLMLDARRKDDAAVVERNLTLQEERLSLQAGEKTGRKGRLEDVLRLLKRDETGEQQKAAEV